MDLGLPSGLKWCDRNLGASKPEDSGLYTSWGNLDGHMKDSGYDFSTQTYNDTPGRSIVADLTPSEDIVRSYLGDGHKLPSTEDVQELVENTTSVWTRRNGVFGYLFTSNINRQTLFIPACGYYDGTQLLADNGTGYYWTLTYTDSTYAKVLEFNVNSLNPNFQSSRRCGLSIRPLKIS